MSTTSSAKKKKRIRIFLIILAVLVIARLLLPYFVLKYVNKTLANMDGYYGQVEDIDIALYRGAYRINDIYINKVNKAQKQTEFFKSEVVDLSVEWKALFKGELVGELEFINAKLAFTKDKAELGQVAKDTGDFRKLLKDFMPLRVNRVEVKESRIHYVDKTASPAIDVSMTETYILAQNLTNADHAENSLPSTIKATANAYEGQLEFNMKLNALAKQPKFDMDARLQNTNMVLLNDFFQAYGNFDINKGSFGLYTEFAAKDGGFTGYVKPIIKELDVRGPEDNNDTFLRKLWESVVGAVGVVFENRRYDQVATKVPIKGKFDNPDINTWEAVWELVRNAFIQALMPQIDQQINLSSVDEEVQKEERNLIQRIFTDKEKQERRREKREQRKEERKNEK